MTFIW